MQNIQKQGLRAVSFLQQLWPGCFGLLLLSVLALAVERNAFAPLAAETKETYATVVWYVQGGYWRDDVEIYLAHAENVFCPNSNAASRISLEDDE